MKIILVRHGRPEVDLQAMLKNKSTSADLKGLLHSYNLAGLDKDDKATSEVVDLAASCNLLVHSDMPRAVESATALGLSDKQHYSDPIFREPGLPFANWRRPKLMLFVWFLFFRLLWIFGYSNNAESITNAKLRAAAGTKKLIEYAQQHHAVMLVGHGFVNRFIAKELLSIGWKGPKNPGNNYWEYGIYEHNDS